MTTLPRLAKVEMQPPRAEAGQGDSTAPGEVPKSIRRFWSRPGFRLPPLAVRIAAVNVAVVVALYGAAMVSSPLRLSLAEHRQAALAEQAGLVARLLEASLADQDADQSTVVRWLEASRAWSQDDLFVLDGKGGLIVAIPGQAPDAGDTFRPAEGLGRLMLGGAGGLGEQDSKALARTLAVEVQAVATVTGRSRDPATGGVIVAVATPVRPGSGATEVVVVASPAGEISRLMGQDALRLLLICSGAILLSIVLSARLASSIAAPLSALAMAAEQGRDRHARRMTRGRVRIPDLAERPDEIGRLSKAMRGMVAALYDRIDANEQFAADVAHEIKNPLASLRSAVGTLRVARRDDQRDRLIEVIEHDVRRLDRLVSDISNASRLDSDLVREESLRFNLLRTLTNLGEHMAPQAAEIGVEFITDLPPDPILIDGLEERLAQVLVNLVSNAISFCEEGDAVRLWARRRENRVLVVVEDTGPGIPEAALARVFDRFYSERPDMDFGNHSGLGLAISKQIVEAHGGVIWAENIRPTHADITSEPLGARFVVGLPV